MVTNPLFKMAAPSETYTADHKTLDEAFAFAWDEYGRTQRNKMTPREAVLYHFGRMRALMNMACLKGQVVSADGPPLYSWDSNFLTRAELERCLEAEAKGVLAAKKLLLRQRRILLLNQAKRGLKAEKEGRALSETERRALTAARKEGKYLRDEEDTEDEAEAEPAPATEAAGPTLTSDRIARGLALARASGDRILLELPDKKEDFTKMAARWVERGIQEPTRSGWRLPPTGPSLSGTRWTPTSLSAASISLRL